MLQPNFPEQTTDVEQVRALLGERITRPRKER